MTALIAIIILVACATFGGTALVRRYALTRKVLDLPNERSLHDRPVPRGGGLALVLAALGGLAMCWARGSIDDALFFTLSGGGALIALVGWFDDHRDVSPLVRGAAHLAAAGWALYWIGAPDSVRIGQLEVQLGAAGPLLAAAAVVWVTNLYNFMDGIDGLAAAEGVTVGIGGATLCLLIGASELAVGAAIIGAASLGFLFWNWEPARIFMGDVGSGFLGFAFAVLALASEKKGALPSAAWGLLLGVFVFDATATLVRRAGHGERWYSAHRSHAYQRAVQRGLPHSAVVRAVTGLNLILFGMAAVAVISPARIAVIAYVAGVSALAGVYFKVERRMPMFAQPVEHPRRIDPSEQELKL
jgi:Fuc2NAc and GlcNAc transferase